jgi:hypothetical protein
MKKIQLHRLAVVAVSTMSALFVVSAFASGASAFLGFTTAEWLVAGAKIPAGGLATESTGGLKFENVNVGASFLCEEISIGKVEPGGVDTVTEVLTLGKIEVEPLDAPGAAIGIKCTSLKLCEGTPEAWPVGLPFKTLLGLELLFMFVDLSVNAEYFLLCQVLGIDATELCVVAPNSLSGGVIANSGTDVVAEGSVEPLATCNGNAETGLVTADPGNLTALVNGEVLAVSE